LLIAPGSPWQSGYVESFHGKLRCEFLNGEIFRTLPEAKALIEEWRNEYKTTRPQSSAGYRSPAPETVAGAPPLGGSSLSSFEDVAMPLT
jgi:transposase InsO family protein